MKENKGIGFGVFLLSLGILWALWSIGIISFSIVNTFFVLWPLILVVIGVNIIFRNNAIAKAVTWLVFLAVLVSYSYFVEDGNYRGNNINNEIKAGRNVIVERRADTQKGKLKLSIGGTGIMLDSKTSNMLEAEIQDPDITYTQKSDNNSADIAFEKKNYKFNTKTGINNYNNKFHLNSETEWDIDLDTGAVDGNLDMSDLAVNKLTLDTGASSLKLTLGEKVTHPRIMVSAGAAKMDFYVPKAAGVRVKMDGALNSTNFSGPEWEKRDGYYYSKGYDRADVRIEMDVDMGVGKLYVNFNE